jgi:hypothetical protein
LLAGCVRTRRKIENGNTGRLAAHKIDFEEYIVAKRFFLGMILVSLITGSMFAQRHKHQPFDMLIGFNVGAGVTTNVTNFPKLLDGELKKGNYALIADTGVTADFYLLNWLSFNTGLMVHPDIYLLLDEDVNSGNYNRFDDFGAAGTPICLTIPFSAHINVPGIEWLYAGAGLNVNIPVKNMKGILKYEDTDYGKKGDMFFGVPIDIGFDFIKAGGGGMRFFLRATPEFHKRAMVVPIGFIWQVYNFRIFGI